MEEKVSGVELKVMDLGLQKASDFGKDDTHLAELISHMYFTN